MEKVVKTKLTLRVEKDLIDAAKEHASKHEESLSGLVSKFFQLLVNDRNQKAVMHGPITASLRGVVSSAEDKEAYREHLEAKYV